MSNTPNSLIKDISSSMYWSTVLSFISATVAVLVSILLVRILGPANYGVWVTVTSIVATIALYSSLGMHKGISRFIPEVKNSFGRRGVVNFIKNVFLIQGALTILAIVVIWFFSTKIQTYFKLGGDPLIVIALISIAAVLGIFLNICTQGLAAFFKQKELNLVGLFVSVSSAILAIVLVILGFGVLGMLIALIIGTSCGLLFSSRFLRKSVNGINNEGRIDGQIKGVYQRIRKFSLLNYFLDIGNYFFQLPLIVFILLMFYSQKEIAFFALGYEIVINIKELLLIPYRTTMSPLFAHIPRTDTVKIKRAYDFLTKLIIVTFIPVGFGFIVLCKNLVELVYSKTFLPSIPIAQILMTGLLIEFVMTISETLLLNYEDYKNILISKGIALINLPLLILVVPRYGLLGVAVTTVGVRIISKLWLFVCSFKRFAISFPTIFLQKVLLASCVFTVLIWLEKSLLSGNAIPVAIGFVTGVIVFLVFLKYLRAFNNEDRQLIMQSAIPFKKALLNLI